MADKIELEFSEAVSVAYAINFALKKDELFCKATGSPEIVPETRDRLTALLDKTKAFMNGYLGNESV